MTTWHGNDRDRVLSGRQLRYATSLLLSESRRALTLAEIDAVLRTRGYRCAGNPRKEISDALRTEVRRGRVERVERGRYRSRGLARSTVMWWRSHLRGEPSW
jgi:hypothetical protein